VYTGIALSTLAVFAACSESGKSASKYPCVKDADCAIYGTRGTACAGGTCLGAGTVCADRAQLNGGEPSAGPGSATVAATFEEMIFTAQSLYLGPFCEQCSGSPGGGSCGENAPEPGFTSCCKGMLDFYISHRSEIMACSSSVLPVLPPDGGGMLRCTAPQLSTFCGPLATLLDPGCDKG
jgi:hypothetical protein